MIVRNSKSIIDFMLMCLMCVLENMMCKDISIFGYIENGMFLGLCCVCFVILWR